MTPDEAREFLDRLRARGIAVSFDGSALDVSGPVLPLDEEQLRAYAPALLAVLRPVPQPEGHDRPAAQPETHPPASAAPTPVLYRGRPVTPAEVRECLSASGDWDAYVSGTLAREDAYEMTRAWLTQSGQFQQLMFASLD